MPQTVDAEVVDLIGAIYDAVIDPDLWGAALERLRTRFEFQIATLSAHDRLRGVGFIQITANMPDEYVELLGHFRDEALDVWGGASRLSTFPLEEPVLTSHVTSPDVWKALRFYREWVEPQGIVDQVGIVLARDRTVFGALGLSVHQSRPPITDLVLDELRTIAPHLSRAVTISRLLDHARLMATTFEGALEASAAGVVLVADDMRIIHANRAATSMLAAGDPVRTSHGRLLLREEFVPGQLLAAVAGTTNDESTLGRRGIGIPSRLRDGTPISINVMPLERRLVHTGVATTAAAAVFVTDAAAPLTWPADAMRHLYNLTPAEQHVFELVVDGRATDDVATALGIAVSTVRTHLLSVFNKTGVHSRADLQRLARQIRLPS